MDIEFLGIVGVSAITVICFGVDFALKKIKSIPTDISSLICIILGAGLGVLGYFTMPEFPAHDVITAIAIGIVSGLAALGVDNLKLQAQSKKDKKECSDDGEF